VQVQVRPWVAVPLPGAAPVCSRSRHTLTQPLVAAGVDTLELGPALLSAQSAEELALTVLPHSALLNPEQVGCVCAGVCVCERREGIKLVAGPPVLGCRIVP
jgi:hypothetical protein